MFVHLHEPSAADTVDCVYPLTAWRKVPAALATTAPDGSTTVPSIVPALPSDCAFIGNAARRATAQNRTMVFIISLSVSSHSNSFDCECRVQQTQEKTG